MIAFGPIPSRRLGSSLGINHIPPKNCPYSCVYCQVGRTTAMRVERRAFYAPERIVQEVGEKVAQARERGESPDYLTFVPDGEPTLDVHLGREIELLRPLGVKIAVISNAALIWREDVREELKTADWVSLKVDAVRGEIWRRVNRPHGGLLLERILEGVSAFARDFQGELATETMLLAGVNDSDAHLREVADFLASVGPTRAYLAVPTRPPAEEWVGLPREDVVNRAYQILSRRVERVEYLVGYEGNAFACSGDVEQDLLSITAVHPMREEAVRELLARAGADWSAVSALIDRQKLAATEYEGTTFYVRKLGGVPPSPQS